MKQPLFSIVIANYNYGRFLPEALDSIIAQNMGDDVEIIVCDGGSTDNSVEVIKRYEQHIAWWCSEPDGGQSAAFNKGFAHAHGRFLTWLNADDVMLPSCLKKVLKEIKKYPHCEWFTANCLRFLNDGTICEINWGPHYYPKWLQWKNSPVVAFGPSTFFTKRLMIDAGGFDVNQHYIMDSDLWQRFIVRGYKQRRINCYCWGFRMHELSKTAEFGIHKVSSNVAQKIANEKKIAHERSGYRMSRFSYVCCLLFRILDGSLLRRAILIRKLIGKNIFMENLQ